jgi:hypothetical protein
VGFAHLLGRPAAKAEDIGICPYQKFIRSALCFDETVLEFLDDLEKEEVNDLLDWWDW